MEINPDRKCKEQIVANPSGANEQQPGAAASDPKLPFPEFPTKMLVAIEGASDATRRPIAEQVAQALGAVLIDAGRYLRSLKVSCVDAGIDLEDQGAVASHCANPTIDIWVRNQGGLFEEALCFVNSDLFTETELGAFDEQPTGRTMKGTADGMVRHVLHNLREKGRTVMLGRELDGFLFYTTPFRFIVSGISDAEYEHRRPVLYSSFAGEDVNALKIDGQALTTAQACEKLLAELVRQHVRNEDWKRRYGDQVWRCVKPYRVKKSRFRNKNSPSRED